MKRKARWNSGKIEKILENQIVFRHRVSQVEMYSGRDEGCIRP